MLFLVVVTAGVSEPQPAGAAHVFSSLLRFSLRFRRSTRFLCIFSAIFSYRSFSSLAAFLSRMAFMRACQGQYSVLVLVII